MAKGCINPFVLVNEDNVSAELMVGVLTSKIPKIRRFFNVFKKL